MTQETVPTDLPRREPGESLRTVQVHELQRGDWVTKGDLLSSAPAEVLHVEPFDQGPGNPMSCILLFRMSHDSEPRSTVRPWGEPMRLATDAEVASLREAQRRTRIVQDLELASSLISEYGLPVTGEFDTTRVSIRLTDAAELQRVADALDLKVETIAGSTLTVVWPPRSDSSATVPLEIVWSAYTPAVAADPLGFGYSREPEPTFVGTAPVPAHVQGEALTGRDPDVKWVPIDELVGEPERDAS